MTNAKALDTFIASKGRIDAMLARLRTLQSARPWSGSPSGCRR